MRISAAVSSPLVTGIFHPVILLPEQPLEPESLKCLLLHELNHIRRGDLWVRLASMAALTLHWYNPLFHMLDRTVREVGEERCDEDVARLLNRRERLRYGQILLQMAAGSTAGAGPWVLCLSSREALERRLSKMLHTAPLKGRKRLLALLAAAAVFSCGTAAAWFSREPLITAAAQEPSAQTTPSPESSVQKDGSEHDTPGTSSPARTKTIRRLRTLRPKQNRHRTPLRPRPKPPSRHSRNLPRSLHSSPLQRQRTPRKTPRNCA